MIRCTLCAATAPSSSSAPVSDSWTLIQLHLPTANRYLSACPGHDCAEIASWVKAALRAEREKR